MIFLTAAYQSSYPKHQLSFNETFWKPVVHPQTPLFNFYFFSYISQILRLSGLTELYDRIRHRASTKTILECNKVRIGFWDFRSVVVQFFVAFLRARSRISQVTSRYFSFLFSPCFWKFYWVRIFSEFGVNLGPTYLLTWRLK